MPLLLGEGSGRWRSRRGDRCGRRGDRCRRGSAWRIDKGHVGTGRLSVGQPVAELVRLALRRVDPHSSAIHFHCRKDSIDIGRTRNKSDVAERADIHHEHGSRHRCTSHTHSMRGGVDGPVLGVTVIGSVHRVDGGT